MNLAVLFFVYSTWLLASSSGVENAAEYCPGNGDFASSGIGENVEYNYQQLKKFSGCKYIYGDLTVANIYNTKYFNFNLSFLETIEEVSGSLTIYNVSISYINLKNLRVIRGEGLFPVMEHGQKSNVALKIWSNYKENELGEITSPIIDLSGLRSIMQGDISLHYNQGNCHLHFELDYTELFDDVNTQRVLIADDIKFRSRKHFKCSPITSCDESCSRWFSTRMNSTLQINTNETNRAYCWGSGSNLCQSSTKCQPIQPSGLLACQDINSRCFNSTQCCHPECIGGCYGSGSNKCFACRSFKDGKNCVNACPRKSYYDKVARKNKPNPLFKLTYGPFCVKKCPRPFLEEDDSCVKYCSIGYEISLQGKNDVCKPCKGVCRKVCKPIYQHLQRILTQKDIFSLKNCTSIEASNIILSRYAFDSKNVDSFLNISNLNQIFQSVQYIYANIQIIGCPNVTSLSFFENLIEIKGNLVVHIDPRYCNIKYFGFKRLNTFQMIKILGTGLCKGWIPKEKSFNIQGTIIASNKSACENAKCHATCDPNKGCWGPLSTMCVECRNFSAGDFCVERCSHSNYYEIVGNKTCAPCHSQCKASCSGPSDSQCFECRNFMIGKSCVSHCPSDYFVNTSTKQCHECSNLCTKNVMRSANRIDNNYRDCSGPGAFLGPGGCASCKLISFENSSISQTYKPFITCIEKECGKGYFDEELTPKQNNIILKRFLNLTLNSLKFMRQCSPCQDTCITCQHSNSYCHECRYAYLSEQPRQCLKSCPKGTFQVNNSLECKTCSIGCNKCSGPDEIDCQECESFHLYQNLSLTLDNYMNESFTCVDKCPQEFPLEKYHEQLKRMTCVDERHRFLFDPSASKSKYSNSEKSKAVWIVPIIVTCIIAASILISIYFLRQRALAKRDEAKYLNPENEEFIPLNPTSAPPNMAKLLIIKESELRRFDKPIGSGAFGTVYQGIWIPSDANARICVAIKVLTESSLNDELLDEAKVMASIQHPCCIRLLCVCMTSQLQLVSQLMPLGSLLEYMRQYKSKIGSKHMLLWASQIASGMNHLEQHGIIHRDLAARNVLVQSPLQVKITDFGLAKVLDVYESEFQATSGKLPVKWLALESLQHRIFNFKTDVWAFGVTLWELFTCGERPYENIRVQDLCDFLEKGERLPQPNICTLDVYMIMIKCWMLDADSRPSFRELEFQLQKMASDPGRYLYIPGDQLARLPSVEENKLSEQFLFSNIISNPDYGCTLPLIEPDEYLAPTANTASTDVLDNTSGLSFDFLEHRAKEKYAADKMGDSDSLCANKAKFMSDSCAYSDKSTCNDMDEDYLVPKCTQSKDHHTNGYTSVKEPSDYLVAVNVEPTSSSASSSSHLINLRTQSNMYE